MKKKICFVTGSRADYGNLRYLINATKKSKKIKNQIIVTGSHFEKKFGNSLREITQDRFNVNKKIKVKLNDDTDLGIAKATGKLIILISKSIKKLDPDAVVILGDRYEIFAAAYSSYILKKPIVHIAGGDITLGSLDNNLRHSISKMADLHFVTNKLSKKFLINLGVKSKNIFNTGSLAVEAINKLNFLTKNSLEKKFNFKFLQKNILITYHTETLFKKNHIADLQKIFSALRKFPNIKKIFTASNADEGGNKINNEIKKFTSNKRNNAIFIPNLGNLNYLSILRHVDGVIGNSSSGLYEVPSFKKPTINLGYRQKGRLMSKSVISIAINEKLIIGAIKKIYNTNFIKKIKKSSNPYEGKNTAKKITKILERKSFSSL